MFEEPRLPPFGDRPAWVDAERVEIPYRIYAPEPPVETLARLSPVTRLLAQAALTRHHDGFVRERHLREIIGFEETWLPPFVIAPLSEYVIEIHELIQRELGDRLEASERARRIYRAFVADNPAFMAGARRRAISYWSCYHRGAYPRSQPRLRGRLSSTYPAFAALGQLESL